MDILFRERKFQKECNKFAWLVRTHGERRARLIRARLDALHAAGNVEDLRNAPGRLHELKGDRKGQFSLDLDHPYRLLFVPFHSPVPLKADGGVEWSRITAVKVLGIEDTHE